ncbi:hypothetical protein [Vallicoccus soli]|uniref:Aminoglycoside phosphotransferase domain-containing protein n=1 Tax=Vallicoccus soli TaxID=2339232 RepID=A0A3A3ZMJ6_9ACTN|nr:hypothetical protein [Vallicoccus soli]RJK97895.1 hypothetical protein D5H78_02690 [Vallicoccus soli]
MSAPDGALADVARLLWPAGGARTTRRPGAPGLLALPSSAAPRLLVPADVPGAAGMLRRHSTSGRRRAAQDALARAQRAGALRWLPLPRLTGAGGLPAHAAATVEGGHRVGVLLGPPRANAKPVLQVFDRAGRTVAFGKVGHTPRAAALVRHEAGVLRELDGAPLRALEVPRPLHAGTWRGLELLVMSALPAAQTRSGSWEPPLAALRELAEHGGTTTARVGRGAYAEDLVRRCAAASPGTGELARAAVAAVADVELGHGRWHGDWAPWNTAAGADGRVQVWDWERSATGVPLGLDAAHLRAQALLRDRAAPSELAGGLLAAARGDLAAWYDREDRRRATVLLYLLEVLQRYRADADAGSTEALRRRTATVEAAVDHLLDPRAGTPRDDTTEGTRAGAEA